MQIIMPNKKFRVNDTEFFSVLSFASTVSHNNKLNVPRIGNRVCICSVVSELNITVYFEASWWSKHNSNHVKRQYCNLMNMFNKKKH